FLPLLLNVILVTHLKLFFNVVLVGLTICCFTEVKLFQILLYVFFSFQQVEPNINLFQFYTKI
ncbi:MAG: hypothetical protein ACK56F_05290, partial [bacterium]